MKKALFIITLLAFGTANATVFGNTTNNNQTYNQPQGGQGGAGGNANAGAIAGASSVAEAKANAAAIAAQQQGQQQSLSNKIDNKVSNTNLNANTSSNKNDNSNKSTVTNAVTVQGDSTTFEAQKRDPVATAYAASIAPTAPCMGSTSGGVQTVGFGFSLGGTWTDDNCVLLEQVRAVSNVGEKEVAIEMLNELPAYKAAKQRIADRKSSK